MTLDEARRKLRLARCTVLTTEEVDGITALIDALETAKDALAQYAGGKTWQHIAHNALAAIETAEQQ